MPKTAHVGGIEPAEKMEMKENFLNIYRCGYAVAHAAKLIGVHARTIYTWLGEDPDFKTAYHQMQQLQVELMEQEADRRGVDGYLEDVYYQGNVVGQIRRFSDRMLEMRLKALAPEKYRETVAHVGDANQPLVHTIRVQADSRREALPENGL